MALGLALSVAPVPSSVPAASAEQPTVDGIGSGTGIVTGGTVVEVTVAGRGNVPTDATAAALTLTATGTNAPGYLTVYPCHTGRPLSSHLNFDTATTIATTVVTQLSPTGTACIFASATTHLIVDVNGSFDTTAFQGLTPARLLDTRTQPTVDGIGSGTGIVTGGTVVEVTVAGRGNVPTDATAAALTLTATGTNAPGYLTVYPCHTGRPLSSHLNFDTATTIATTVVTQLSPTGTACIFASATTHLIVDVNGSFDTTAFQGLTPARLLDTRTQPTVDGIGSGTGIVTGGTVVEVTVAGRGNVPTDATAAALTLTATGTNAPGYLTVYPCHTGRPLSSHLNFDTATTIATTVVTQLSPTGTACIFASATTHLIVDVNGSFDTTAFQGLTPARLLDTRTEESAGDPDRTALPAGSGEGRRVVYSKVRMRVWRVEADGSVSATYRVSGRITQPKAGTYEVWSRSPFTCAMLHPDICMRYMVRFAFAASGQNIGFHEIPARNGVPLQTADQLGLAQSGGCVRQATADAIEMWEWAQIGTKVVVVD
ncbi:MAG: L,D-transpeptidase [Acidimicrobiaceae bacterium]|nr:L,D-transpeptidase [Acidimicrobiaceae bacterium]